MRRTTARRMHPVGRSGGAAGARKKATKSKRAASRKPAFPLLGKGQGYGVWLRLADSTSDAYDEKDANLEWVVGQHPIGRGGKGRGRSSRKPRLSDRTTEAVTAAGHPVRAKLLSKLLEGPATYQALKRMSKLEPGPLYFHIGQLRACGLIMPRQRDLYELTRGGRNLILTMMAMGSLIHDRRRCPVP